MVACSSLRDEFRDWVNREQGMREARDAIPRAVMMRGRETDRAEWKDSAVRGDWHRGQSGEDHGERMQAVGEAQVWSTQQGVLSASTNIQHSGGGEQPLLVSILEGKAVLSQVTWPDLDRALVLWTNLHQATLNEQCLFRRA